MYFIIRNLKRLGFGFAGIWFALKTDFSYRTQVWGVASTIGIFVYIFWPEIRPLSQTEILFLVLGYTLVLITELQNSSFETALDHMHPEMHHNIGRSKDMAAGAVLTAVFFLFAVMALVVFL